MQAMEYEKLDVKEFRTGMILALRPPIEVRRGMMLLRKTNCQVVFEGNETSSKQEEQSQAGNEQAP